MADHTAAEIFGTIFCELANSKGAKLDKKKFTKWLWEFSHQIGDFTTARQVYYRGLRTFPRFGDGWLARVAKCEAEALALPA